MCRTTRVHSAVWCDAPQALRWIPVWLRRLSKHLPLCTASVLVHRLAHRKTPTHGNIWTVLETGGSWATMALDCILELVRRTRALLPNVHGRFDTGPDLQVQLHA